MLNGEEFDITAQSSRWSSVEGQHDQVTIKASSPTLEDTDGLTDGLIAFRSGNWRTSRDVHRLHRRRQGRQGPGRHRLALLHDVGARPDEGDVRGDSRSSGPTSRFPRPFVTSRRRTNWATRATTISIYGHSLAQTEESDWATILTFAKRIGWTDHNRYGVVHVLRPGPVCTREQRLLRRGS